MYRTQKPPHMNGTRSHGFLAKFISKAIQLNDISSQFSFIIAHLRTHTGTFLNIIHFRCVYSRLTKTRIKLLSNKKHSKCERRINQNTILDTWRLLFHLNGIDVLREEKISSEEKSWMKHFMCIGIFFFFGWGEDKNILCDDVIIWVAYLMSLFSQLTQVLPIYSAKNQFIEHGHYGFEYYMIMNIFNWENFHKTPLIPHRKTIFQSTFDNANIIKWFLQQIKQQMEIRISYICILIHEQLFSHFKWYQLLTNLSF